MKFTLNIPTTWNELSPKMLKRIAWYFFNTEEGKKLDLLIYFTLLNIKWWQFKKMFKAIYMLNFISLSEIKKHYSFIYKQVNRTVFIPTIKTKLQTLFAPGNRMHNITIQEFAVCEDFFFYFAQTGNIEYIRYIAAVLYREKRNGKKVPFDKGELDERVVNLSKLDNKTLTALMLCYKGSSLEIQNNPDYKRIFRKAKVVHNSKKKTEPTPPGFGSVIEHFAGGKFGTLAQTQQTNIHDFLREYAKTLKNQKAS